MPVHVTQGQDQRWQFSGNQCTKAGLIDRMSLQTKTGQFRLMATVLILAVLVVTSTSPGCPLCDDLNVPVSQQAAFHSHGQEGSVPPCDKDACSCCGLQFVASVPVLEFDLIGSTHVREFSQLSVPAGSVPPLYRPPRV